MTHKKKRYEKTAAEWQNLGGSWDRFQSRDPHYHKKPVHFGSAARRSRHIPNYTGCIGSTTLDALDNLNGVKDEHFQTLTAVRTEQPKPTDVSWRPFIPKYGGQSHWLNVKPIHSRYSQRSNIYIYVLSDDILANTPVQQNFA